MTKFEDCIQEGDKIVITDGRRVNISQLYRVAKKEKKEGEE